MICCSLFTRSASHNLKRSGKRWIAICIVFVQVVKTVSRDPVDVRFESQSNGICMTLSLFLIAGISAYRPLCGVPLSARPLLQDPHPEVWPRLLVPLPFLWSVLCGCQVRHSAAIQVHSHPEQILYHFIYCCHVKKCCSSDPSWFWKLLITGIHLIKKYSQLF